MNIWCPDCKSQNVRRMIIVLRIMKYSDTKCFKKVANRVNQRMTPSILNELTYLQIFTTWRRVVMIFSWKFSLKNEHVNYIFSTRNIYSEAIFSSLYFYSYLIVFLFYNFQWINLTCVLSRFHLFFLNFPFRTSSWTTKDLLSVNCVKALTTFLTEPHKQWVLITTLLLFYLQAELFVLNLDSNSTVDERVSPHIRHSYSQG